MSGNKQPLLDAIGLLTVRAGTPNNVSAQVDYLQQIYEGDTLRGAGQMTAALAALCEHLVADIADLRGITREDVLRELAARFVAG